MREILTVAICTTFLVGVAILAKDESGVTLRSPITIDNGVPLHRTDQPAGTEILFRGDLTPELGLGCSNPTGNSGGPNDWAVGVTAQTVLTPFDVTFVSYNIFTQVSPNINAFSFVAWAGGGSPGAEIDRQAGLPFSQGNHTAVINPGFTVNSAQFFFGFNQNQANVGMRLGLDSSSGSAATSFIRAPACGAGAFTLIDNLGFPGNWVMAATINGVIPVELMDFDAEGTR